LLTVVLPVECGYCCFWEVEVELCFSNIENTKAMQSRTVWLSTSLTDGFLCFKFPSSVKIKATLCWRVFFIQHDYKDASLRSVSFCGVSLDRWKVFVFMCAVLPCLFCVVLPESVKGLTNAMTSYWNIFKTFVIYGEKWTICLSQKILQGYETDFNFLTINCCN